MKLTTQFKEFINNEKSGGVVLICVTILSLLSANSVLQEPYQGIWQSEFFGHTLVHWINDGVMTLFFLLVGLELKREMCRGELSDIKSASLPVWGAVGGMLVPALIYSLLNHGSPFQSGAGIPMATDIAFAIGILSILKERVPASPKVFLTALAIIDDLGAILIIALFYSSSLAYPYLLASLAVFASLLAMNKLKIGSLFLYLLGGVAMWYFMLNSGIHATITGVLLAFAIPIGHDERKSLSIRLEHRLQKPVAFIILPLFAAANTGIALPHGWAQQLTTSYSLGIVAGLVLGKPLGIALFSYLGTKLRFCTLPGELNWMLIIGAGCLGGIGFTMSIFISMLAFEDAALIDSAKIAIFTASVLAGIIGLVWLKYICIRKNLNLQEL